MGGGCGDRSEKPQCASLFFIAEWICLVSESMGLLRVVSFQEVFAVLQGVLNPDMMERSRMKTLWIRGKEMKCKRWRKREGKEMQCAAVARDIVISQTTRTNLA